MKIISLFAAPTLSPQGFLAWAVSILLAFAAVHVLGWREATSLLTGTVPQGSSLGVTGFKAMFYMAAYFGTVIAAPILLIAAAIGYFWQRSMEKKSLSSS